MSRPSQVVNLVNVNEVNEDNNIENASNATCHSANEDSLEYIPISEAPLNLYKTQIIIKEGKENRIKKDRFFGKLGITCISREINEKYFQYILNNHTPSKGLVAVYIPNLTIYSRFQDEYLKWKSPHTRIKFIKCSYLLFDCTDKGQIQEEILREHKRNNHRGIEEVFKEIKTKYYHPNLKTEIAKVINNCHTCQIGKYERRPAKIPFNKPPIPEKPHETAHMDIWFLDKNHFFLTLIDKFSKFAQAIALKSRNWVDIKSALNQYFATSGKPKLIITDNESSFKSNLENFLQNENVALHFTTPGLKTGNSDVERLHNTLNEHVRIKIIETKLAPSAIDVQEIMKFYNTTIHSSTNHRPIEIHNGIIQASEYNQIRSRLVRKQDKSIENKNRNRKNEEINSKYIKNKFRRKKQDMPFVTKPNHNIKNKRLFMKLKKFQKSIPQVSSS